MGHLSKEKIRQAKECFEKLGLITSRSQFGGYSLSVNAVMLAIVFDGKLYLRANDETEIFFRERGMMHFVYSKRGMPISLRYYHVDESLWNDNKTLLRFAQLSYEGALAEFTRKQSSTTRLKDLPNLSIGLERLLWKAGIKNVHDLRNKGAKHSYLKLKMVQKTLGINVLLSLAGAISGYHQAVLPVIVRNELLEWFKEITMLPGNSRSGVRRHPD